jgi:hypothetical protein
MPSIQEQIVNAVVSYLDAQTYSQAFTPTKQLVPVFERDDLSGFEVSVYAGPTQREKQSRSGVYLKTYSVGVVVRYGADVAAGEQETRAGAFMQLCEEIAASLESQTMAGLHAVEIDQDGPFDPGRVNDVGLFFTTITNRYKGL